MLNNPCIGFLHFKVPKAINPYMHLSPSPKNLSAKINSSKHKYLIVFKSTTLPNKVATNSIIYQSTPLCSYISQTFLSRLKVHYSIARQGLTFATSQGLTWSVISRLNLWVYYLIVLQGLTFKFNISFGITSIIWNYNQSQFHLALVTQTTSSNHVLASPNVKNTCTNLIPWT